MDWIARSQPDAVAGLVALVDETWTGGHLPPGVLEVARLRVGWLLGSVSLRGLRLGPIPDDFEVIADIVVAGRATDLPDDLRLVVTAADQFVLDAHGIDDAMVAAFAEAFGSEGAATLVVGLGVAESLERLAIALDLAPVTMMLTSSAGLFGLASDA